MFPELRKRLFRAVKEAFPHGGRGFAEVWKSMSGGAERALWHMKGGKDAVQLTSFPACDMVSRQSLSRVAEEIFGESILS